MSVTGQGGLSRSVTRGLLDQATPGLRWAVAVVLLGVSGLFGGLDSVPDPQPETLTAGTPVYGGPWEVTVEGAVVQRVLGKLRLEKETNRWLVLTATVRITAHESSILPSDLLTLDGVTGLTSPTPADAALDRDKSRLRLLQPDMPERVLFIWEQSGDAPVPSSITVSVKQRTYREDSLSSAWYWMDSDTGGDVTPAGIVTVPVRADLAAPSASPSPLASAGPTPSPGARPTASPKTAGRTPSAGPTP
ncbi:hypothetical protein [Catellatospora methionotrophica]|uniref:hypothetical protein n=1 Tax=Catellatospora methionotrophica TaxID=121620 RepID=UPI0033C0E538